MKVWCLDGIKGFALPGVMLNYRFISADFQPVAEVWRWEATSIALHARDPLMPYQPQRYNYINVKTILAMVPSW